MEQLTERQRQILSFIQKNAQDRGSQPSIREIAKRFKIASPNGVYGHLRALREKGYLEDPDATHRGLKLTNWRSSELVPELGQVRAGAPILAEQNIESYISVDKDLARGGKLFALKVNGDSMKDAGIHEGDKVIVRQQDTAQDGDIVVALKGDEATVKHFRHRRGQPYLEPANPKYEPMPTKDFSIIGKVVGLTRKYGA